MERRRLERFDWLAGEQLLQFGYATSRVGSPSVAPSGTRLRDWRWRAATHGAAGSLSGKGARGVRSCDSGHAEESAHSAGLRRPVEHLSTVLHPESAIRMDVSVVIPTRNRSALLAMTLRSVLRQRDVDLEVIVVDEASTDDTPASYWRRSRLAVRVIRHDTRRGVSAARESRHSRGACRMDRVPRR